MRLDGCVALITGASRGIGRGIAIELAKKGCNIAINYLSNDVEARKTLSMVQELGVEAILVGGDVSKYDVSSDIVSRTLGEFGRIDILVNNAGIFIYKLFKDMTREEWDRLFRINVYGTYNMIKHVLPHFMERRGGLIVNISSIASSIRYGRGLPSPGRVGYIATKSAINGMTLALAMELSKYGIRVNAVAPGLIDTDMVRMVPNLDKRIGMIPVGRIGRPEEIGKAVVFIAENDYLNGEIIVVSGGE